MTGVVTRHCHMAASHAGDDCAPSMRAAMLEAASCSVGACSVVLCHNPAVLMSPARGTTHYYRDCVSVGYPAEVDRDWGVWEWRMHR